MPKKIKKVCKKHGDTIYTLENRGYYRCMKCISERVVNTRVKNKLALVKLFGGKCVKCGYNKSAKALQFHHTNPNEKKFQISRASLSLVKLIEEAKKCILVCANCHCEIEEELDKNGIIV